MIRRTLAIAIVFLAALVGLHPGAATATPAAPAAPTTPAGGAQPSLTLVSQPVVVEPTGLFTVVVAAANAPEATDLAVDIYAKVEPGEIVGVQPEEGSQATFPVTPLADVGSAGRRPGFFTIHPFPSSVDNPDPAWGYEVDEPGVYPVRVRLWDEEGNTLASLITSMIRLPEAGQEVAKTEAALLVPVHRPPPEDPDARATADAADASLLEELRPTLDELAARPALPATFSVTPDTIARVAGDPEAANDLRELRRSLDGDSRALLDAPYVDIDAASLVDAGLGGTIELERDLGRETLRGILGEPAVGTWQLHDRVDAATLSELRTRGIFRTLLPGDAMQRGAGVQAPVDVEAGNGHIRALAVSDAYDLSKEADDDPVLAAHRLLGRLASAGPGPTGSSGIVVTIDPAAVDGESLRLVADALLIGTPFFSATTVPELLDATPTTGAVSLAPPAPTELGTYPADYLRSQASLTSYQSMVGGRNELIRPFELTLAISAASDLDLAQRERDARSVDEALQVPFTAITMPAKDKITLGAEKARFPLPIDSTLDYPVKVVIELESNDRVEFPTDRIEKTLKSGSTVVTIPVKTKAAGDTPIRITVRSPDDGVILAESQYTIRSTAVSGVGIVLTVSAALFLAVWWGRHWRRNRGTARESRQEKRRRHEEAAAARDELGIDPAILPAGIPQEPPPEPEPEPDDQASPVPGDAPM